MTRVALCGERFREAADVLALEVVDGDADLVLLDLEDAGAVARAERIAPGVPRVVIGRPEHAALLRATGCRAAVAVSAEPAVIGPLVASAIPERPRRATRLAVVTGARGGIGRTLLVAGLAERIARRLSVLVIDATGSGDAGRRLALEPGPWTDLEGLASELTTEQLGIVAAQRDALRVIGGPSAMPSGALLATVARESVGIADVVIVDAPSVYDERTAALRATADRVLLVVTDDTGAAAGRIDDRTWVIVSRSRPERVGGHPVMCSLPEDRTAHGARPGGALARAYDDLAELLIIDAT